MKERALTLGAFAVLLALGTAYVVPRMRIETDVAALLPAAEADDPALRAARALARGPSTRIVSVEVRAADADAAWSASTRVDRALRASPRVAYLGGDEIPRELARLARIIDGSPEALGGETTPLDPAALDRATARLRDFLATPFAADHARSLPRDPLLARLRAWDRVAALAPPRRGTTREGRLVSRDARSVIETFALRRGTSSDDVLALVRSVERAARGAELRWSGVPPIVARATASIRGDVERVSTLSTIGVLALLGLAFGRLRYVFVASLPLAAATLASLAAGIFVFGRIHGIALAFAGAMIGVVVDYVEHFLAHRMMSPVGTTARTILDEIRPSLLLAAATTLVGVAGFAGSGFPGFREITLVAGVGVLGGLLTTLYVVPRLVGPHEGMTRLQRWAAERSKRVVHLLRARRAYFGIAAACTLVASALVLSHARSIDDPSTLSGVPPQLLRDDRAVRAELGSADAVLIASPGTTCDEALTEVETMRATLGPRLPDAHVRAISELVPPAAIQRARIERVRAVPEPTYRATLERADFDAEAFAPFFTANAAPKPATVSLESLASAAPLLLGSTLVRDAHECWVLSSVDGATPARLRQALGSGARSVVVDSHHLHADTYRRLRVRVLGATAVGLVAVVALCFARYRSLRRTVVACAPAVLSALAALSIASLFAPLDLLHGLGALLVVSMGTDYGIFFVDSAHDGDAVDATFASVAVSALTTILSFGMLGLSHHRALASLGTTTALGVTLAVLLAPSALALVREKTS